MRATPVVPRAPAPGRRTLVVSPHCDDAVLSLGAWLARHVRQGGQALVLTVFAGDPTSPAPAGPWDAAAGFTTEGEAAGRRRLEDAAACARLGAQHLHVDERDEQYVRQLSDTDLWARLRPQVELADEVFLPGFPLRHPDHARTTAVVLRHLPAQRRIRIYVEQPYALRERAPRERQAALQAAVRWSTAATTPSDVAAKARAVRCYRSQLPLLGPGRLPSPSAVGALVVQAQLVAAALAPGERVSDAVPAGTLRALAGR